MKFYISFCTYTRIKQCLLSLKIAQYIIRICNQETRCFIENETIYIMYIASYLIIRSLITIPIILL